MPDDPSQPTLLTDPFDRRPWQAALVALLALGTALRSWQALRLESLWRDEVALALNFDARGLGELLLRPLEHRQMAPPGFLALVEIATSWLGGSTATDLAFRVVPWLISLAGLAVAVVALRQVATGWPLVVAMVPFAVGTGAFYYGTAFKSYGADVAVCLLLLWAALRHLERPTDRRHALVAGWLGGPALLLSFPAVPLAGCLAPLLGLHAWRTGRADGTSRQCLRTWLHLALPWTLFATLAAAFVVRLRDRPIHDFMLDYWQTGFPDLGRPVQAALLLPRHAAGVVQHFLFFRGPDLAPTWLWLWMKAAVVVLLLLAAWGLIVSTRRSAWRAAVLATPPAVAAALAFGRLYPFLERLGLWTVPSIMLLAAFALDDLWRRGAGVKRLAWASALACALPILVSSLWLQTPPTQSQAVRPVVEELARRVEPGDLVYVPCGGGQLELRFYARRFGLSDLAGEIFEGSCHPSRTGYLREAAQFIGHPRVWLFHSHRPRGRSEWVLDFYRRSAEELDRIEDSSGLTGLGSTRAFLFDLGPPSPEPM